MPLWQTEAEALSAHDAAAISWAKGPGRSLDLALWADRDVVPADWPTRVFTPKQWDALSQPPLDVDERPSLW